MESVVQLIFFSPGEPTSQSIFDERDAKLRQDIKELDALLDASRRLQKRLQETGPGIINWMPKALRQVLRASVLMTPIEKPHGLDIDKQRKSTLCVLCMLEILDWEAEVLIQTQLTRRGRLSEDARRRLLEGELLRIAVSSEDLRYSIEEELRELVIQREQEHSSGSPSSITSPDSSILEESPTGTYAHPMLNHTIPTDVSQATNASQSSWTNRVLIPEVRGHARQRANSFPLALGLLARCVVKGTLTPSRLRTRARSMDDNITSGAHPR